MQYRDDGLTLWYGDSETPAPSRLVQPDSRVSITVGVRPAHLTNAVEVEYRINGGLTRTLQSSIVREDFPGGAQFFRSVFPYLPPGSHVDYAPILRTLGRRIGTPLGQHAPSSFSVAPSPQQVASRAHAARQVAAENAPGTSRPDRRQPFPYTLVRLAQVQASLAPPQVIGMTPDGLRINFAITGGRITGDRLNATVEEGGADCLRIREDGTGIVAVRTTIRTDDAAIVYTEYSGVLDLGEDGYRRAVAGHFPQRPRVHLAPRFLCGAPAYAWLNRLQCVGIGYVTMADLEVNYDLYAMHLADAG